MRCSPNLRRTLFSAGLGLVLLSGCARAPVIPSAPLTVTAEELVILLREREIAVQTLKAQFAVEASGAALKAPQRMEAALVYRRPGTIRLQTFARMGFPLFALVLNDGSDRLLLPWQGD